MVSNLRRSQVEPGRDHVLNPRLLLVLLIAAALASCQSAAVSTPDPNTASNALAEGGDVESDQLGDGSEDLSTVEEAEEEMQCLFFAGDVNVESVDYTDPPCNPYQDCPDPNVEVATGMGEGDPVEGQGDCSQAPAYCFEQGMITNLVSYLQPGRPLPIKIRLNTAEDDTQVNFEFDHSNNEDASMIMIYFYNYAGMDSFYLQTLPLIDGFFEFEVPFDLGAFGLSGSLGEMDGNGTFSVSHPELGEFITGSWSVSCQE